MYVNLHWSVPLSSSKDGQQKQHQQRPQAFIMASFHVSASEKLHK